MEKKPASNIPWTRGGACPDCGASANKIRRIESDLTCTECGRVVDDVCIEETPEWHHYPDEDKPDLQRCQRRGVCFASKDIVNTWDNVEEAFIRTYPFKNMEGTFTHAKYILMEYFEERKIQNFKGEEIRKAMIGATLYIAFWCMRTLDIAVILEIPEGELKKALKEFSVALATKRQATVMDFVASIVNTCSSITKRGVNWEITRICYRMLENLKGVKAFGPLMIHALPENVAATLITIACNVIEKRTKIKMPPLNVLSEEMSCSVNTLNKYREFINSIIARRG